MKIAKDRHGIVLTADGEPVMRFPKTKQGLAEAKRFKKSWKGR